MNKFPKISLITPSFNHAKFIRITIDSILSQNYPNLEYIVMDGGSIDGTVEILKSYGKRIRWISKKDKGQSDAINKGFKIATGEIVGFINSDDYLAPGSLNKIAEFFTVNINAYFVTGKCYVVDENNHEVREIVTLYKNFFLKFLRSTCLIYIINYISQPATFWRKKIMKKVGYFDENLHYSMDYEYWLRLLQYYKLYFIDEYLAYYRVHNASKAVMSPENQFQIEYDISRKYTKFPIMLLIHKAHYLLAILIYRLFFIK